MLRRVVDAGEELEQPLLLRLVVVRERVQQRSDDGVGSEPFRDPAVHRGARRVGDVEEPRPLLGEPFLDGREQPGRIVREMVLDEEHGAGVTVRLGELLVSHLSEQLERSRDRGGDPVAPEVGDGRTDPLRQAHGVPAPMTTR